MNNNHFSNYEIEHAFRPPEILLSVSLCTAPKAITRREIHESLDQGINLDTNPRWPVVNCYYQVALSHCPDDSQGTSSDFFFSPKYPLGCGT